LSIAALNEIPIKYSEGQTVFFNDVGQVHDGWAVQQNIVRTDGRGPVLLALGSGAPV
jgi:multidrug efflux pump subunit AcrB